MSIMRLPVVILGIIALVLSGHTLTSIGLTAGVAPTLGTPANGTQLAALNAITLTWSVPSGTTQYQIQVVPAKNDGPGINLIRDVATTYTIDPPVLGQGPYVMLPGMTYTWRVRATTKTTSVDEADSSWGAWSDDWTFTTPAPSAAGTTAIEPAIGTTALTLLPALRWSDNQSFVFYYELQLSKDPTFNTNPATATASVYTNLVHGGQSEPLNTWRVPANFPLEPSTQYYWRVRPRVQGNGTPVSWSQSFSFMTASKSAIPVPPKPSVAVPQWVKTGGPVGGLGYDVRMRPDNPDMVFATDAWSGVHKSTDGGKSWLASNTGIVTRGGPSKDSIPVFSLSIARPNPNELWAGTQGTRGIFKSSDSGASWKKMDSGVVESEGITVRGFGVHPFDANIVFAAAEIASNIWAGSNRQGKNFDLTQGVVYKTIDGGQKWEPVWRGDSLARYVWVCPRNPNLVLVSTGIFDREAANSDPAKDIPGGVGVLKSTDQGKTWKALGQANGLGNLYIGSLMMHPVETNILLAATGNHSYREGSGVYRSTDMGEHWELTLQAGLESFTAVKFATSDPRIAYAGTAVAFYRSQDTGLTWQLMSGGAPDFQWGAPGVRAGVPIDFDVDPRNPARILANNYGGGNFLSEDSGKTWTVASQGYTGAQLHDVAVSADDPQRVYTIGRSGVFGSSNGGTAWEGLNFKPANFPEWYDVAVDPTNADNLIISDEHQGVLLQSGDAGHTWKVAFRHPQMDPSNSNSRHGFKAIAYAPSNAQTLYAGMSHDRNFINNGNSGPSYGVFKSTDGGTTWQGANDSLSGSQNVSTLAIHPGNPQIVYAGTIKDGVLKTVDGGRTWVKQNQGLTTLDVRGLAIDPKNTDTLYAGVEQGGVYKSTDGGAHWQAMSSGLGATTTVRDIVVDMTEPKRLYAAAPSNGVYRSENSGQTWSLINAGLDTRAVKALTLSTDGTTLYAATEGEGVYRVTVAQ